MASSTCSGPASGPWVVSFTVRTSPTSSFRVKNTTLHGGTYVGTVWSANGQGWNVDHDFDDVCPG